MYTTQYTFCTRASALNGMEWDGTTGKFGGGSELGPTWRDPSTPRNHTQEVERTGRLNCYGQMGCKCKVIPFSPV
jgi:hypothetical protein